MSNEHRKSKPAFIPRNKEQWSNLVQRATSGDRAALRTLNSMGIVMARPLLAGVEVTKIPTPEERAERVAAMASEFGITTLEGVEGFIDAAERILTSDPNHTWEIDENGDKAFLNTDWELAYRTLVERMRAAKHGDSAQDVTNKQAANV